MTTRARFRHLDTPADLRAAFGVMQQFRPNLRDSQAFAGQVARQQAQGYRLQENLIYGRFVYVDDLVVDASQQRGGLGGELLCKVREQAVALGCAHFVPDTGLHMALAQRFYFRQGLLARGLHFSEPLPTGEVA
ncbi:hypothetical protein SAMN05216345_11123 [Cupriavidus sp. YR651]|uniref:GNAT family N-acetyltransferase n=1 Tax=Cupriavidus sp. YR651 TaxID=1855315 RepID=UPI0008911208|nr:GNAT family N-acetyltransferase [Cupriavidus sp. YR651]SDD55569.1 hypothetical protein SAMN05216345_11123 [Cupriavidus sp. YR651]